MSIPISNVGLSDIFKLFSYTLCMCVLQGLNFKDMRNLGKNVGYSFYSNGNKKQ